MIKILAIDDPRTIREMLKHTLTAGGYDVELAEDGINGLEKLHTTSPNLVITDINMPRKDGFGVIEGIRAEPKYSTIPILVLTTESADVLKQRARDCGATGWIVKPFDDEKIIGAIRKVTNW